VIGVFEVDGMTCTPLPGVQVDIWHADAVGVYSDVAPGVVQSVDTRGEKFLRGWQISDAQGIVVFDTIYPGWYMSRAIHIHFKLRMPGAQGAAREFTSQMFFDEAINTEVLAKPAYSSRSGTRSVLNDDDHIYNGTARNGQQPPPGTTPPGSLIMPLLTTMGSGYSATLKIGLMG
jgi:protocatechuate 3,4-dioxygenase beta subunit